MRTCPVFDSPAAFRIAKAAIKQSRQELDQTPRHLLDPGNPNHPDNFDVKPSCYVQQCKSMISAKPVKTDLVFANLEGSLGFLWSQFCSIENQLAEMLHPLPLGTAVVLGGDAWVLREDGDALVLVHGNYAKGEITGEESRFDFDLSWVDIEEDELQGYINRVKHAMTTFNTVFLPEA